MTDLIIGFVGLALCAAFTWASALEAREAHFWWSRQSTDFGKRELRDSVQGTCCLGGIAAYCAVSAMLVMG